MTDAALLLTTFLVSIIGLTPVEVEDRAAFTLEIDPARLHYRVVVQPAGQNAPIDETLMEEQFGTLNGASIAIRDKSGAIIVESYSPVVMSGQGIAPPPHYRPAGRVGPLTPWLEVAALCTGLQTARHPRLSDATAYRITVGVRMGEVLRSEWHAMPDAVHDRLTAGP